jgi:hypothetical protein
MGDCNLDHCYSHPDRGPSDGLSKDREICARWQRACELLLAEADLSALSKGVELALF